MVGGFCFNRGDRHDEDREDPWQKARDAKWGMRFDLFGYHSYGGGPAHVLINTVGLQFIWLVALSIVIFFASLVALIYGSHSSAPFSSEVSQYLLTSAAVGFFGIWFFIRMMFLREATDVEWTWRLLQITMLNVLHYGLLAWGGSLVHRLVKSSTFVSTRMYFSFYVAHWMSSYVLSVSLLNGVSTILTAYIVLGRLVTSLASQVIARRYSR